MPTLPETIDGNIFKELDVSRTPNDDRSDSMNPNNDAYWDSLDNHSNQLNPEHDAYHSSRDNTGDDEEED